MPTANDAASSAVLSRRLEYGDGGSASQPSAQRAASRTANRLGRLQNDYDAAGLASVGKYDFKGNPLRGTRRLVRQRCLRNHSYPKFEPGRRAESGRAVEIRRLNCAADGATYQEALANVQTVIAEWIETAQELGRAIPQPKGRLMFA